MTILAAGGIGAGLTGFLVVLVLCIAAVFLFRSMSKHLRKVPKTFEQRDANGRTREDETPRP